MCKKLILAVVLITWLSSEAVAKPATNWISRLPLYAATSFDYDYGIEARRKSSTTERPIVRYWNNFVRNLPIPPIPWNMTNTLTNLFNAGASNVIETPVGNYQENSSPSTSVSVNSNSSSNKRKSSRKHKTSTKGSKNRRRPQDNYELEEGAEDEQVAPAVKVKHQQQQPNVLLSSIPAGLGPNKAMYFYDPNSNQYFEVKRLRAVEQFLQNNYPNGVVGGLPEYGYDDEDEDDDEVVQAQELLPQMENTEVEEENDVMDLGGVIDGASADELEELPESMKKAVGLAMEKIADKPKKNEEMLRNVIGSQMQDDRFTRKRQRANTKRRSAAQHKGKHSPRDSFRYYYLQG